MASSPASRCTWLSRTDRLVYTESRSCWVTVQVGCRGPSSRHLNGYLIRYCPIGKGDHHEGPLLPPPPAGVRTALRLDRPRALARGSGGHRCFLFPGGSEPSRHSQSL